MPSIGPLIFAHHLALSTVLHLPLLSGNTAWWHQKTVNSPNVSPHMFVEEHSTKMFGFAEAASAMPTQSAPAANSLLALSTSFT